MSSLKGIRDMESSARNAIKASFWRLLEEKPLNHIKIKDIIEDCGINRNTFYYHFEDIYDLLDELLTEETQRAIRENADINSLESCIDAAAQFTLDNRRRVLHIYHSMGRELLEKKLMELCRKSVENYLELRLHDEELSPEDKQVLVQYYQCECFGQVIYWMDNDMDSDIKKTYHRLCRLRKGMPEEMIKRCKEEKK